MAIASAQLLDGANALDITRWRERGVITSDLGVPGAHHFPRFSISSDSARAEFMILAC